MIEHLFVAPEGNTSDYAECGALLPVDATNRLGTCHRYAFDHVHTDADERRAAMEARREAAKLAERERYARNTRRAIRRVREVPRVACCPFATQPGHKGLSHTSTGSVAGVFKCSGCGAVFQLKGLAQIDRPALRRVVGLGPVVEEV